LGFPSIPAGRLTSDSFLVWRSYSSVETNFSQDILAQDDLMELVHVLRKMHTSSMSWYGGDANMSWDWWYTLIS